MSTLTTAVGDTVTYDHYGPADAPGVLFIQGAGPTRADDPVTTETARLLGESGVQAVMHDRVGRGDSPAAGPIPLERELAAITALAATMPGPVVLVGHSSGCAIAMIAAREVAHLGGLVLWEAPLGQFPEGAPAWWAGVAAHIAAGRLQDAVAAYMVGMPPEWLDELRRSPAYPALIHSWIPDGTALAGIEEDGVAARLHGITAPVLAVVGTETFPGMAEAADAIAEAAAVGTSECLTGAWHSWDPAAMSARLAAFIRDGR
ncbi:alpha/beta fold hydrolase [Microbacterium azadirachtae]|uniref:Alpha/beta hydrolase family protein n=1 Tax=Microbacterium azadirachtae TaxID=582680 RepID=A0A0F0LHD0_9MICO|nr:alpha/beta hydrolase [Microbacterium azadirachtae]KJL32553.1 Alpha/beta hydrolase family protein [Microbacterium azadirachtae]